MYSLLAKRGQLFAILLGVTVVAIFLGSVIGGLSSAGYSMSSDLNQIMKDNPDQTFNFFNFGLYATVGLILIAAALAIFFGLFQMLSNIKGSLTGIIALVAIIALFFLFYSTGSDDLSGPLAETLQKFDITANISKFISGGLWTTILLAGISIVAMVLFEIWNAFK
jgi:hypothetical protein